MSNSIDLQGGKSIKNNSKSSGNIGHSTTSGVCKTSTLAEDILHSTTRRSHSAEGGRHELNTLADSCHEGNTSSERNIVRVVTVRNPKGEFKRPILNIALYGE